MVVCDPTGTSRPTYHLKPGGVLLERGGCVMDLLHSFDSLRLHAVKL